mmetsp:Transcript_19177/g.41774  ORF Transcript_19177/g.41774 Transcript_19177/m.41774 type:complete len:188 (+) Transcript_19177:71-634(+)
MGASSAPASAQQEPSWQWPRWCLRRNPPCIEVLVVDDDTGRGVWVEAVPQERVTGPEGRDAYLCAEYMWEGEQFVEDFRPERVRRRGDKLPVSALCFGQAEETPAACAVCLDALSDVILVPCLHGGLCSACASRILAGEVSARCPQCRTTVERFVRQERRPRSQAVPTWEPQSAPASDSMGVCGRRS